MRIQRGCGRLRDDFGVDWGCGRLRDDFGLRIWELMGADPPRNRPQSDKIIQIEGFEAWDPSHEKEREKICRKLKSRASETVWASSYGQITVLRPRISIFVGVWSPSRGFLIQDQGPPF